MSYTQWEIVNAAELELLTFDNPDSAIWHYLSNYALENEGESCATIRNDEGTLVATITVYDHRTTSGHVNHGYAVVVRCSFGWASDQICQYYIKYSGDHYDVKDLDIATIEQRKAV